MKPSREPITFAVKKCQKILDTKLDFFFPIDKKDSHKLFEPKEKTNFIVGNWSRYCTVTENTNFRKIWIGIKWNGTKFLRESDNQPITWANFKHSDNYVDEIGIHGCKYQTR